jgi:hypothetical protein
VSLHHRFIHTMASVWLSSYNSKRDGLAYELRKKLKLAEQVDLSSAVTRFVNFDLTTSSYFAPMRLVFWEDVVAGDYPLYFLKWWEDAYVSYDLDAFPKKREQAEVRALLAEAEMLFKDESNEKYPRFDAMQELMQGVAIAVERRTLGTSDDKVEKGLVHLEKAISLFRVLKPQDTSLSNSDQFHIASAVHLSDWLLSELDHGALRIRSLKELNKLGAIKAYAWLAKVTGNWVYAYNVAEIYGELGNEAVAEDAAAEDAMIEAIRLNPRLACFELETKFDGVDEPLSKAPALRQVLPKLSKKYGTWLNERAASYRRNERIYQKDVTKGIKVMLKEVGEKTPANWRQRIVKALPLTMGFAIGAALLINTLAATFAFAAKPIF